MESRNKYKKISNNGCTVNLGNIAYIQSLLLIANTVPLFIYLILTCILRILV